jgi:catechol 2,3-dioxygenase-like lactoylglutathione lyase family enzyme
MIASVAHVCFRVKNLEASLRFYRDALGLKEAFDFKDEKGRRFGIYLHAGYRTFIELFEEPTVQPTPGNASFQHICLEVDNIHSAVAALKTRGIAFAPFKDGSDIFLAGDNSYQAWLADPDGNRIELHQYTATSLQKPFAK